MKKLVLIVSLFVLLAGTSIAQTTSIKKTPVLSEASPESVGLSSERVARIDKMCEEEVANGSVPGIVSLMTRNGKIVY